MPPKSTKGKSKNKDKETAESKLIKMRKEKAVFPPILDEKTLKKMYQALWASETRAHPATQVRAASAAAPAAAKPGEYPFFTDYFWCGLCPPYS